MDSKHSIIKMKSIAQTLNRRRILFMVVTLLCLTNAAEGKMRLVPKGKKNKNKKLRNQQKNKKQAQIILKPRKKEAATILLQATIGQNEKGEKMLLLSDESVAAVSKAMQSSNTEVKQEPQQSTKEEVQEEVKTMASEEKEPMEQQVLFYDPAELKTAAGEIPKPKRVFDADGNEVDITGKEAELVPPPPGPKGGEKPPPPPPEDDLVSSNTMDTKYLISSSLYLVESGLT